MNKLQIILRSKLRNAGLLRHLTYGRYLRGLWYEKVNKPPSPCGILEVSFGRWKAKLSYRSLSEYVTLKAKKEDCRLMAFLEPFLLPGFCMWDIGANVGFYSLFASQFVGSSGKVLAFDPEPSCRERLRENLELNRVANVSILPFALGQKSEEHLLCVVSGQPAAGSHHLLAPGAQPGPGEETVVVQVLSGDEACTKHSLPMPTVIKIDVEGFELDVIKGLRSILSDPTCTTVLTEVHFSVLEQRGQPFAPLEVADTLSGFGFGRQRWLDRSHLLSSKGAH